MKRMEVTNTVILKTTIFQFGLSLIMTSLKVDDISIMTNVWLRATAVFYSPGLAPIKQTITQ